MQEALSTGASGMGAVHSAATRRRVNGFLVAGAAVVTAGALVAGPATPSLPVEIQNRAVQLTALSAKVTDSPFVVYSEIVGDTLTNVVNLGSAWLANPFPVVTQVASNQIGYASEFFGGILALPTNWDNYTKTERAQNFLKQWQDATAAGNTGAATQYGSSYVLYGALAALSPIYNSILSYTPRGSTVKDPGIPEMIFQNLTKVVATVFSPATFITGVFQSVYGAAIGAVSAFSDCVVGLVNSVSKGDIGGAINSVLNMPGFVVNALLNGWQHPTAQAPFPALLTYQAGGTNATTSIGLLGQLLVKIPAAIAAAIKPATTTTTTTTTVAALSATDAASSTAKAASAEDATGAVENASAESTGSAAIEEPDAATTESADSEASVETAAAEVDETASATTESTEGESAQTESSSTESSADDTDASTSDEGAADETSSSDAGDGDAAGTTDSPDSSAGSSSDASDSGSTGTSSSESSDSGSKGASSSGSSDSE